MISKFKTEKMLWLKKKSVAYIHLSTCFRKVLTFQTLENLFGGSSSGAIKPTVQLLMGVIVKSWFSVNKKNILILLHKQENFLMGKIGGRIKM